MPSTDPVTSIISFITLKRTVEPTESSSDELVFSVKQNNLMLTAFPTHNWEKSSFFNTLIRVFARLYANT